MVSAALAPRNGIILIGVGMQAPQLPTAEAIAADPKYGKRLHAVLNHLRQSTYDQDDVLQFMAFAMPLARHSKAQLFQDLWALWASGQRHGGYFVEFGAGDGLKMSNTWLLEVEMGWRGILAEPNPTAIYALRRNRRCQISTRCVYSRSGETLDFLIAEKRELSRLAGIDPMDGHEARRREGAVHATVQTISLADLLIEADAPRVIDYMSVDTEGSEMEILEAFDFGRWDIRAISVEHNGTAAREGLFDLLCRAGYRRQWPEMSLFDDWYIKV